MATSRCRAAISASGVRYFDRGVTPQPYLIFARMIHLNPPIRHIYTIHSGVADTRKHILVQVRGDNLSLRARHRGAGHCRFVVSMSHVKTVCSLSIPPPHPFLTPTPTPTRRGRLHQHGLRGRRLLHFSRQPNDNADLGRRPPGVPWQLDLLRRLGPALGRPILPFFWRRSEAGAVRIKGTCS